MLATMSNLGKELRGRWVEGGAVESDRRQFRTSGFVSRNQISCATVFQGVVNVRAEEDIALATLAVSLTGIRTCVEVAPLFGTVRLEAKRTVADGSHSQHAAWLTYRRSAAAASANDEVAGRDYGARGTSPRATCRR
jgi:hypothetical protein